MNLTQKCMKRKFFRKVLCKFPIFRPKLTEHQTKAVFRK